MADEDDEISLDFLKDRRNQIILGVLAVAAIAVFIIFSNTGGTNQQNVNQQVNPNKVLATVEGAEITQAEVNSIKQRAGPRQNVSDQQALESAINQEVLYQKAKQEGFVPTNREVKQRVNESLQQQGQTLQQLKQRLQSQGTSFEDQLSNYKRQLAVQSYLQDALDIKNVTDQEARNFYQQYNQTSQQPIPPYEQIKPQIVSRLEQQKRQQAIQSLIEQLKPQFDIQYK